MKTQEDVRQIPTEFLCPISLEVMNEPMLLVETGVTYDKKSIETWLHSYGHDTCPVSRRELKSTTYVENRFARVLINDWLRDNQREHEVCCITAFYTSLRGICNTLWVSSADSNGL